MLGVFCSAGHVIVSREQVQAGSIAKYVKALQYHDVVAEGSCAQLSRVLAVCNTYKCNGKAMCVHRTHRHKCCVLQAGTVQSHVPCAHQCLHIAMQHDCKAWNMQYTYVYYACDM